MRWVAHRWCPRTWRFEGIDNPAQLAGRRRVVQPRVPQNELLDVLATNVSAQSSRFWNAGSVEKSELMVYVCPSSQTVC